MNRCMCYLMSQYNGGILYDGRDLTTGRQMWLYNDDSQHNICQFFMLHSAQSTQTTAFVSLYIGDLYALEPHDNSGRCFGSSLDMKQQKNETLCMSILPWKVYMVLMNLW